MKVWRHPEWHVPVGQVLLRAAVPAGAGAGLAAAAMAGSVPGWVGLVAALLALVAMAQPDSMAGWALVVVVGLPWLGLPAGSVTSAWLLLAAAGAVTTHVALLVAAQGPAVMRPDPVQVRLWVARGAGLWAVVAGLWLAARLLRGTPTPAGVLVAVLVVLTVAITGATARVLTADGPPA